MYCWCTKMPGIDDVGQIGGTQPCLACQLPHQPGAAVVGNTYGQSVPGPGQKVLGTLTSSENPSKPILEVFFHGADACLVTSNAFVLACELNPQLGKQLKVLAISPAVVPTLFFFRPGHMTQMRSQMESAILTMNKTSAGREVLTVFQSDGMMKCQLDCLDSTRRLLKEYDRARHQKPGSTAPP